MTNQNKYDTSFKQRVLEHYQPHVRGSGFQALADRYDIAGGRRVVRSWYGRWDGTPQSLERREGSGRPTILSPTQIHRHIGIPIKRSNAQHHAIHYNELYASINAKTGKEVSPSTVRRYGYEREGIRRRTSTSKETNECKLE
jgi:hypothetical protein